MSNSQSVTFGQPADAPEGLSDHDAKMLDVASEVSVSGDDSRDPNKQEFVSVPAEEKAAEVKDDIAGAAAAVADVKDETVPAKFLDKDGNPDYKKILQSQQELEKKLTKESQKKTEDKPKEAGTDAAEEVKTAASVITEAQTEYARQGELSTDTYDALAAQGYTRTMVDTQIAGVKAEQVAYENATFEAAGGEESFRQALAWGGDAFSTDEIKAFNDAIGSNNVETAKEASAALKARFDAEADIEPTAAVVGSGVPAPTGGDYFKSGAEMQAAMNSPKYKSDPAYRNEVATKIGNAEKHGVNLFAG